MTMRLTFIVHAAVAIAVLVSLVILGSDADMPVLPQGRASTDPAATAGAGFE